MAATADTSGSGDSTGADAVVTVNPWETRALEIALLVIGGLVLAFGGFVAAFPESFGTGGRTASTSVAPVTLARLTTLGTTPTPTVVTQVTLDTTSAESTTRTTSDTWLGTIFGIGALIVLSGALYRRVTSIGGFGITIGLKGVIDDPATQEAVAKQVKDTVPHAAPDEAARIYARATEKLRRNAARRSVKSARQPRPPAGMRDRLSALAERATSARASRITISAPEPPAPQEIKEAVEQAAAEERSGRA